jgi:hypothetical protein
MAEPDVTEKELRKKRAPDKTSQGMKNLQEVKEQKGVDWTNRNRTDGDCGY